MFNFTEFCKTENIPFREFGSHKNTRPGWVQVICPFPGCSDRNFHCGYPEGSSILNCYKCGVHTLWDFLLVKGFDPGEILKGTQFSILPKKIAKKQKKQIRLPDNIENMKAPHKKYLMERGFDPFEIQHRWGVQGISIHPPIPWRLIIPVYSKLDFAGWTSRRISKTAPSRYITAPGFAIKDYLYGEHLMPGNSLITLVEGPTDAWALGAGTCALFGVNVSNKQILKIIQYKKACILFDADKAGKKGANELYKTLDLFMECHVLNCAEFGGSDPGELNRSQRKKLIEQIKALD